MNCPYRLRAGGAIYGSADGHMAKTNGLRPRLGLIGGQKEHQRPLDTSVIGANMRVFAGAALDQVSAYVGSGTEVLVPTLAEAVFRTGSYLSRSGALLGFHGSTGEGTPDADPARGGYSALRRSGSMNLLELSKVHRAGLI